MIIAVPTVMTAVVIMAAVEMLRRLKV